jgi:murein DD-endopeptidase MepM/ murein hydrolase activator NlpD
MRTTLRRLIVAAVLGAAIFALVPVVAHAATAQQKLDLNQEKLSQARARIAAAKKQQATLNGQLAALDDRLTGINDRLAALGDRVALVQQKLDVTQQKLDVLRGQLRLKRAELKRAQRRLALEEYNFEQRVSITYKTDQLSYVDIIMSSADFEDLVSRMSLVHDLLSSDKDFVAQLQSTRNEVRTEKQQIAQREGAVHKAVADLRDQHQQLAALQAAQAAEQAAALAARQAKRGALAGVNGDLKLLAKQQAQLMAESAALTGIINGSSGGGHGTGSLMWPVSGPITCGFGWRIHPISHQREFHTGIDIGVGYGVAIHAADGGKVIFATYNGGYGNCTVIDHGNGVSTLYGHQSRLAVSYGQSVQRGQVIGYVGSTGYSTGPHLHFEVRRSGQPVDPLGYLP